MNGPSLEEVLRHRRVLVCVGAGGVGKTTLAAAVAMRAAALGRSALVCTIDPARRLANALGLTWLGNAPTDVSAEVLASAERSALPKRDSTDWLSTTAPTRTRRRERSAWASSSVSLTGSSSGRLTSTAEVMTGSVRRSSIHPASVDMGPEGSAETRLCGTPSRVRAWPVAGRSSTIRSKPPGASGHWRRCHITLPSITVSASEGTKRRK